MQLVSVVNEICNDIQVYESEFLQKIPYFMRNPNACAYSCPRVNICAYIHTQYTCIPMYNFRQSHVEPLPR